mmetsp:Transcript_6535/g.9519  ORF Transcript_6535/g.9519 Transcript_6535/m.9519 type:complete len:119 (+) Transcript_6535:218-574(+)
MASSDGLTSLSFSFRLIFVLAVANATQKMEVSKHRRNTTLLSLLVELKSLEEKLFSHCKPLTMLLLCICKVLSTVAAIVSDGSAASVARGSGSVECRQRRGTVVIGSRGRLHQTVCLE